MCDHFIFQMDPCKPHEKKQRTDPDYHSASITPANLSPASVAPANDPAAPEATDQITTYKVVKRTEPPASTTKGTQPSKPIGNFPLPSMICPEAMMASRALEYLTIKLGLTGLVVVAARILPVGLCLGQLNGRAWEIGSIVDEGTRMVKVTPDIVVALATSQSSSNSALSFMTASTSTVPSNVYVQPNGTVHVTSEISAQEAIICDMVMPTNTLSCTEMSIAEKIAF